MTPLKYIYNHSLDIKLINSILPNNHHNTKKTLLTNGMGQSALHFLILKPYF